MSVNNESEVDCVELAEGWEAARTSSYLRNKWSILRRTVPRYQLNSYTGTSANASVLSFKCVILL